MMGLFSFLSENGRRCSALLGKDNLLIEVSSLFPIGYHLVTFYCSLLLTWHSWHHHYCKDLSFITFYFIIGYNFIGSQLPKILCRGRACPNLWNPHLPLDWWHPRCPPTHPGKKNLSIPSALSSGGLHSEMCMEIPMCTMCRGLGLCVYPLKQQHHHQTLVLAMLGSTT